VKFENAALFLRLHTKSVTKTELFENALQTGVIWTPTFCFRMDGNIVKWELFGNDVIAIFRWFSCPPIVMFLNSPGVVWTENIWCAFRVKPTIPQYSVDGALNVSYASSVGSGLVKVYVRFCKTSLHRIWCLPWCAINQRLNLSPSTFWNLHPASFDNKIATYSLFPERNSKMTWLISCLLLIP